MSFKDSKSASRRRDASTRGQSVEEIDHLWKVRRFRYGSRSGPAFVEFTFPTEGGGSVKLCVRYSELRHRKRLLDQLSDYLPVFPDEIEGSDSTRFQFVQGLIATQSPGDIEVEPDRTGFFDKRTFVTFNEIISSDGSVKSRRALGKPETDRFDDVKGTPEGTKRVLKLTRHSTYLSWAIGVTLVAPLLSYAKLFRPEEAHNQAVVSETCVFNLWGESGSGKTDTLKTAMSLAGSPEWVEIFDFSRRGLEEMASRSNDLPLVIDDTEYIEDPRSVVKAFKSIVHKVPGGRSKVISNGVDAARFPRLRWSTFGLSSSPRPISILAEEAGWAMTQGQKVRLPDIAVPGPKSGGIFDRISGSRKQRAAKSIELINKRNVGTRTTMGTYSEFGCPT
jgi:hypothetical protein